MVNSNYYVKIKHPEINSGNYLYISCKSVTPYGKTNTDKSPDVNSTDITHVQTQTIENPTYTLSGVKLLGAGYLSYPDILTLYRAKYDDSSNVAHLVVSYASCASATYSTTPTLLVGAALSAPTEIPVILDSFSMPIDMSNSRNGYMPDLTLKFTETL